MSTKQFLARQGDVMVMSFDGEIPSDAVAVPNGIKGRIVLAYGEATGHHHSIAVLDREAELLASPTTTDRFLRIMASSGVELTHQEHATITLAPGNYVVRQQREYVAPEIVRQVLD
jgi:hypothetical protein